MKVELIAHTQLAPHSGVYDGYYNTEEWMSWTSKDAPADHLAEFAGRSCYQSFHRPNPKSAANADYIANILQLGHESVLEHASATFYITGVSRALTHELIRHRHLSFSELSQRFVDMTDWQMVRPPAIRDNLNDTDEDWTGLWGDYADSYSADVDHLTGLGLKRKQAREAARWQLPNATETRIVVTGNMRAWRDVLKRRYHVAADAELQELSKEILRQLRQIAPNTFQDFPEEPYS